MNFRLPALALLTVLLSLPYAYGQTSAASYLENINQASTTLTLNSSSSVVGLEIPLTLSAVVSYPRGGQTTGNVTFTVENGSMVVASNTTPVSLTGEANWSPALPSGTFTIFAIYSGDSNLLGSTSPVISQTVLGPPDFSLSASPISVSQGQTADTPIAVTAINGFHGTITFSCVSPSSTIYCALSPSDLVVPLPAGPTSTSVSAGTVALSATTFATTVEKAGLVGAFLLGVLSFKRRKQLALLGAVTLTLLLTGCGVGTRYLQRDGTPKGTYSITVRGTSGKLSHTQTVLLTVR
jgi:large repetitive protein